MLPQHNSALKLADEFIEFFTGKVAEIQNGIDKNLTTEERGRFCCQSEDPKYKFTNSSFRELREFEVDNLWKKSTTSLCDLDPIPTRVLKHIVIEQPQRLSLKSSINCSNLQICRRNFNLQS